MIKKKWNDNWLFWNSKNAFALVWNVPSEAKKVDLPHDAMLEEGFSADSANGGNTGFFNGGSYTYIKNYISKKGDRAKNIMLQFEGIYMNSFVYVNGQLAANRPYGYSTFIVELSPYLKEEGENEIRVQVRNGAMQNSRWYTGSGIYRDVYLLEGGSTYIKENGLRINTESCDENEAIVLMKAFIGNRDSECSSVRVSFQIKDKNGNVIAEEEKLICLKVDLEREIFSRLFVDSPKLWSAENPELYKAVVTLRNENGKIIDETVESFGIRSLKLDARHGLRVNGKTVKLRGACIHHDNGPLGARSIYEVEYRRIKIMKEAGFNAIRMSHHPASPALLRACDELGVYVMDEAFDMWSRAKSDYDYNLFFRDWWERDVESMVVKDYNHPSVILYSIGNEIPEIGTEEGSRIASDISGLCHKLDKSRYTLAAINGVFAAGDAIGKITADIVANYAADDDSVNVNDFMTLMDKYMDKIVVHPEITKRLEKACAVTDIAGYNYMTARYELDAKGVPNRIMVGSETYPPEIALNWQEVMKYPQVIGDFTWTGWDYIGEAGVGIPAYRFGEGGFGAQYPARLAYTGDIDITGFRRPLSYYREIVFGIRKAPYIAVQDVTHYGEKLIKTPWVMSDTLSSWTFSGYENKPVIIEVYSCGDEVELFLNDVSLGRKEIFEEDKFRVLFETVYKRGTLKAVSYMNGEVIGEYSLSTAEGIPELRAKTSFIKGDDSEIVFVELTLQDKLGNVFTDVQQKIKLETVGNVRLLGACSANPKAADDYLGNEVTTYKGRALAILKKESGNDGKLILKYVGFDKTNNMDTIPLN